MEYGPLKAERYAIYVPLTIYLFMIMKNISTLFYFHNPFNDWYTLYILLYI